MGGGGGNHRNNDDYDNNNNNNNNSYGNNKSSSDSYGPGNNQVCRSTPSDHFSHHHPPSISISTPEFAIFSSLRLKFKADWLKLFLKH
jgi:hypothetical protein